MPSSILLASFLSSAQAANLKIVDATASSSETATEGASYDIKNIRDNKASSVWVEGVSGSGLGEWVELSLDGEQTITGLRLWNGNWYTHDFWKRHNRVKEIEVEFSSGDRQKFTLTDAYIPEEIRFSGPVTTSSVKVKIKSVYGGSTFNDTCLSEVQVFDDTAVDYPLSVSATASSIYAADNDGSYEPEKMQDGLVDTMWCEASADGDGVGEWVEYTFDGNHSISSLVLVNGNGFSFSDFMKSNSARAATLTFSSGQTEAITIKPSMVKQTITFPAHSTSSVRMTFTEVKAGKEFNDLCISEAYFK